MILRNDVPSPRPHRRRAGRSALVLAVLLSMSTRPSPGMTTGPSAFARLHYPGIPHLDPARGTIEMLVRLNFDPDRGPARPFFSPFYFLTARDRVDGRDRRLLSLMYKMTYRERTSDGGMLADIFGGADVRHQVAFGGELARPEIGRENRLLRLRADDRVHLAVTWDYTGELYRLQLFVNGQRVADRQSHHTPKLYWGENPELWIGSPHYHGALGDVYAVHVSSAVLDEERLQTHADRFAIRPDAFSLLYEDFSHVPLNAKGRLDLPSGGHLEGAYQVISDEHGRAIRMHRVPYTEAVSLPPATP